MSTPQDYQRKQMRLDALSLAIQERGIILLHQDRDHRVDFAENPPKAWADLGITGMVEADFLPEASALELSSAHDRCRSLQQEQTIELELASGSGKRLFEARLRADETGVLTILTDITDERLRDTAMTSLLRELSHRSKNLLAIVQSVAMQTAHHSDDTHDFLDKFRGRLHALSSAQDLVTDSDWRGSHLQALVSSQLKRVSPGALANMRVTGENPLLGPNASLHIGLAIHELAANALDHGALAKGNTGKVWLDARINGQPGLRPDLVIQWSETGIAADSIRHKPSFGTLVLERIVPLSVGGAADFSLDQESLTYRLIVPADQFEV